MNDLERYLFDLRGYLVINDVLAHQEVDELLEILDRYDYKAKDDKAIHWLSQDFMELEEPHFRQLINQPVVMRYLNEILGDDFRLDHWYGISTLPGAPHLNLHGGGTPFDPAQYYTVHNSRIHCGLTVVYFALTDILPGEGGFCCLPGSHKSNFPVPEHFINFEDTSNFIQVPIKKGSVLIFTEALTHGTWPYKGKEERKGLFYKYSPAHLSYGVPFHSEKLKELCTTDQRTRIELPFIVNRKRILRASRRVNKK